jgi:thiamine-monophosphate kinase
MTEAEFIAALRRLPLHPAARGLNDDTALLDAGPLVVTTDTLVEGLHFLPTDPAQDVAWKLVATNLSDLAAKGAVPEGILLNYPLGDDAWDRTFLEGLADILTAHDTRLIGGDTVTLPPGAPRILTVTAFGSDAAAPARAGAKPGDALYVTGTIGDAGAGLAIALGKPGPAELLAAYRRPQPRLADGRRLARHVHAMMDVSDGLLIDAARMALASGLAVAIDLAAIPLSDAYRAAPEDFATDATRIGAFLTGSGLVLHDAGTPVPLPPSLGYEHRA